MTVKFEKIPWLELGRLMSISITESGLNPSSQRYGYAIYTYLGGGLLATGGPYRSPDNARKAALKRARAELKAAKTVLKTVKRGQPVEIINIPEGD